jgi:hypothetical protein
LLLFVNIKYITMSDFKNPWGGNIWGAGNHAYDRWFDGSEAAVWGGDASYDTEDLGGKSTEKSTGSLSISGLSRDEVVEILRVSRKK